MFKFAIFSVILIGINVIKTGVSGAESKDEVSLGNATDKLVTLRLTSENGTTHDMKITENLLKLLTEVPKTRGFHDGCPSTCRTSLSFVRNLQNEYGYKSLFELHYFLSVSRGCFCYENDFDREEEVRPQSSSGSGLAGAIISGGNNGISFQWALGLGGNRGNARLGSDEERRGQCQWENVIYWIMKLIDCRIYDLSRWDIVDACYQCICRR